MKSNGFERVNIDSRTWSIGEEKKSEDKGEILSFYDVESQKLLYLSPLFESHFGIPAEEMMNNPTVIQKRLEGSTFKYLRDLYTTSFHEPIVVDYRTEDCREGSEERWYRTTLTPIIDDSGKMVRVMSLTQDITVMMKRNGRKVNNEPLALLGQIAAAFAHEIRNPLTSIKGFCQLLEQEKNNPYQTIIRQETEKIESIINEFLMLAQPVPELDFSRIELDVLIENLIDEMNAEQPDHHVEMFLLIAQYRSEVFCSPGQIKQAIRNLLQNSIDAMPFGGRIFIYLSSINEREISIRIRDEGPGIPIEKLRKLGKPAYSNKEKGLGLGIMISRQIIQNHSGTMLFSSEPGTGTTVDIQLPMADSHIKYL